MYVLYKMDFVLVSAKEKQSIVGDIRSWFSTKVDKLLETFGYEQNETLKNFFRMKALRGLKKEGLIERINIDDS